MNAKPGISIPPAMLPSDGRFGSGPSRIPSDAVNQLAATETSFLGTSHRKDPVKSVVGSIREGLTALYELPDGYEVVLGLGGATAFWDVATFGLIHEASAHFVCGEFSTKFADGVAKAPHLQEPVVIAADPGDAPTPEPVNDVDTAAFIHNETSTGVRAPFARLTDAIVLVDGTSGAGAIGFNPADVDVYYFSPQKALASEGGLWVALMSRAAIDRAETIAASGRWIPPFLSLTTAIDNSRKNQTYNTPALATLWLLDRQLSRLNETGGLSAAEQRSTESSNYLYTWAHESTFAAPFVQVPVLRSPTVVTIDLADDVSADAVSTVLRGNGIVDTESYRKLGRNQLRIATFPATPLADIEAIAACIDYVVPRL
ncbi:MAG: phosphoserine transaminase [Acidimicrobiia bacterium]